MVQPAVARGEACTRHEAAASREAQPLRIPGLLVRHRRRRPDRRLRAGVPLDRRPRPEDAPHADRGRARLRTRRGRALAGRRARTRRAAPARGRAGPAPPAALGGRGGAGAEAPGPRRAAHAPAGAATTLLGAGGSSSRTALPPPAELVARYRGALPFTLTDAQDGAIAEIDGDLGRTTPMQRLLQGDVGSGKTAVALYALLRAVEGGRQGALMAPTETLAEQHFLTIEGLCTELGVRVALLTSSLTARERRAAHQLVASGDVGIAVGTHALIQREVSFADLAVAVVDEQHRFGVEQRAALAEARSPHVLHMTATPIPRTLALTVYGDLAVPRSGAARRPEVRSSPRGSRRNGAQRPTSASAATSTTAGRPTSSARSWRGRRRPSPGRPRTRRRGCAPTSWPAIASAASTDA